jgi:hypothetical protein
MMINLFLIFGFPDPTHVGAANHSIYLPTLQVPVT